MITVALTFTLLLAAVSPEVELQKAVMKNDKKTAATLLESGARQIIGEQNCLMMAGYVGDVEMVELLLKFIPGKDRLENLNFKGTVGDNTGNALLFTLLGAEEKASTEQRGSVIETLVKEGIELDDKDSRGRTTLMIAFSLTDIIYIKALSYHPQFSKEMPHKSPSGPFKGRNAISFLLDAGRLYMQTCTSLLYYHNKDKTDRGKRFTAIAEDFVSRNDMTWAMHFESDQKTCSVDVLWAAVDAHISGVLKQLFQLEGAVDYLSCKRLAKIKPKNTLIANSNTIKVVESKQEELGCEYHTKAVCDDDDVQMAVDTLTEVTPDDFTTHYYLPKKPLIIKDATLDWPCSSWTVADVRKTLGAVRTTIAEIPYASQYGLPTRETSYSDFINTHIDSHSHWYAFDNSLHHKHKESMTYLQRHPVTGKRSYNPPQWSFGGNSSGSPPHFHQDAFNGLCFGTKIWKIWPPGSSFISTRTAKDVFQHSDEFPPHITVEQHAGDLLYIPKGWAHAILNIGTTLAAAVEYY